MMSHPLLPHFQMLARYNTLANQRLYEACAQLTNAERQQIRPAFFKSIQGTLNHIMVGDNIWLTRFSGKEITSQGLDAILYEDFVQLWEARKQKDAEIEEFFLKLEPDFLNQTIRYINNAGHIHIDPTELLITHFFNHQTHHRGQVHDMLSQTTVAPPSLDLHRVLRPHPQAN